MSRLARRRLVSALAVGFCRGSVLLALVPLVCVLVYVVAQGATSLDWGFFTAMPRPVGEAGGGMANAIAGTLILIGLASLLAVPVGIAGGIYLSEFGGGAFGQAIRFSADVLNGVPSIVVGIFAYGVAVLPFRRFSALAGGLALGIMMLPIIVRTTEELLRMVPHSLREGALALGATRSKATLTVVVPAALPGILTGVLVAVARVAGETAPLLFTAFNNQFWSTNLTQPIASLTVQMFTYAVSPYDDWHRQAWAGACVLVIVVSGISLLARAATARLERMHR